MTRQVAGSIDRQREANRVSIRLSLRSTFCASRLTKCPSTHYIYLYAGVTQLVECLLPKQNVTGSNPVTRSTINRLSSEGRFFHALTPL
jgi:hypothetical protein